MILGVTLSSTFGTKTLAQTTAWATGAHNYGSFYRPDFFRTLQRVRDLRDNTNRHQRRINLINFQNSARGRWRRLYFDRANYYTFESSRRFYSPLEEEFNALPRENRLNLDTKTSVYAYAQATWQIARRFSATPGIRRYRYGITWRKSCQSAIGARFGVNSKIALTFAAGVCHRQPPGLFILSLCPATET